MAALDAEIHVLLAHEMVGTGGQEARFGSLLPRRRWVLDGEAPRNKGSRYGANRYGSFSHFFEQISPDFLASAFPRIFHTFPRIFHTCSRIFRTFSRIFAFFPRIFTTLKITRKSAESDL